MELQDYLTLAKRRAWIVLLVAAVAALSAFVFCRLQIPRYKSTMALTIVPARADFGLAQSSRSLIATYNSVVFNKRNAAKIVEELKLDYSASDVLGSTKTSEDAAKNGVQIEVTDYDGDVANRVARQWALLYKDYRDTDNAKQRREDRVDAILGDDPIYAKTYPQTGVTTAAAGVLGLLVGGLVAALLEWAQSNVLRTKNDVERKLSLSVIGAIPTE